MITSECPLMYFEILCKHTSAPKVRGLEKYGDKKVLSTRRIGRRASGRLATISEMRVIGGRMSIGFVGDSIQMICGEEAFSFRSLDDHARAYLRVHLDRLPDSILAGFVEVEKRGFQVSGRFCDASEVSVGTAIL